MNRLTNTFTKILLAVLMFAAAASGRAQAAKLQLDNLDKLSDKAAHFTDVTLDGTLLDFAIKLIERADDDDPDVVKIKSVVKNLKGIYIKSFEFDEASKYSKADVDAIRSQLTGRNWTKMVQSVDKRNNEYNEIYLLKNGDQIGGIVVLVAEARELTVVNIVGDVPLDKIAALEDHFAPRHKDSDHKNKQQKKESSHEEE